MRIAALVSGGVDSSVALCQLLEAGGHEITAFYLKIWLEDELAYLGNCPWQEDLEYVRAVCEQYQVPLQVVSLQKEYLDEVVSYVLAELKLGNTPSPDILCNSRIKFGAFYKYLSKDYDKIATGHYASIEEKDGLFHLVKGVDPIKDQAYFLSHLSQEQLSRCLFPLGQYPKAKVRELARAYDLPNKDRPDSQGICFLGKISYNDFIGHHLGKKPGSIRCLEDGKILGQHQGFWFHTIGQRKGLGLSGGPWFVVKKDVETNTIFVSHEEAMPTHKKNHFTLHRPHWISQLPQRQRLQVKIRHGRGSYDCEIKPSLTGDLEVQLDGEDAGIAPGQFAVLYDQNYCLGGGVIH